MTEKTKVSRARYDEIVSELFWDQQCRGISTEQSRQELFDLNDNLEISQNKDLPQDDEKEKQKYILQR